MDSGDKSTVVQMVKHQGPAKGFDFDKSKVGQIFDLLLWEK
jgi:hypothetical protein